MESMRAILVMAMCLSSFSSKLFAQVGYTAKTAEYLTATSDLVLIAVVADIKVDTGRPKNEQPGSEDSELFTVFLDVHRCLKGQTDESIKLEVELFKGDETLNDWKKNGIELFWFLNQEKCDENGIMRFVPHRELRFQCSIAEPPNLNADRRPTMLLNVDWDPLTSAEMIENTIVQFHKRFGNEKIGGTGISISRDIADRTGRSGDANVLMVPSNYEKLRSK